MKQQPFCLVYTEQKNLNQKFKGYLHSCSKVVAIENTEDLFTSLTQHNPTVLIFDLLVPNSESLLQKILRDWPMTLVVAIGELHTNPMISAQRQNIFAFESSNVTRQRFQCLAQIAFKHLGLIQERELLKKSLDDLKTTRSETLSNKGTFDRVSLRETLRSFNPHQDLDSFLKQSFEWLQNYKGIGNIGLFLQESNDQPYQLKTALKCPKELSQLRFEKADPFIFWLKSHPSPINQFTISQLSKEPSMQVQLSKALQIFFSDLIFPLHGSEGLIGWIFMGASVGKPFTTDEIIELTSILDHISFLIEKSLIDKKINLQKTSFEKMLQALASAIILYDKDGKIIWLNSSASSIFQKNTQDLIGHPLEVLGSQLTSFVYQNKLQNSESSIVRWSPSNSSKQYLLEVHSNFKDEALQQGFILLQDVTFEITAQENDEKIKQAELATRLASHLSKEIRNPLVAIKTFVQLLPERYDDDAFRKNFVNLVENEVERLSRLSNGVEEVIIKNHSEIQKVNLGDTIRSAVDIAIRKTNLHEGQIQTIIDSKPAFLLANQQSLINCFVQLITGLFTNYELGFMPTISISVAVKDNEKGRTFADITLETLSNKHLSEDILNSNYLHLVHNSWGHLDLHKVKGIITNYKGQLRVSHIDNSDNYIKIEMPLN